jgi:biotin transport system substrate-specific component
VSTLALTLAPSRSRASARLGFQVACAAAGSALIAGLAQISIHLGFTPVPITGQTLGVLLIGAAYGPGLGTMTVLLYLAEGVLGLPVFAANQNGGHDTGLKVIEFVGATGGYLWGFAVAGALIGGLSRRGWDRSFRSAIGAMLLGEVVIYSIGVPWLHHALPALMGHPVSWNATFEAGLYPYIIGDTIKLLGAAALLPGAWWLMKRIRPTDAEA